jgi:hypothetical protein
MLELHSIDVIGIEITINDKTLNLCSIYILDWNQLTYQVASLLKSFTLDCSPLNNHNNFVNVLLKIYPLKCINKKKYPISTPWWNELCTIAVKTRSFYFQKFRTSSSRDDFIMYRKACVDTNKS